MVKAVGAALVAFTVGGAALSVLGTWLGGYAEPATLGLVGVGLMASSQLLTARIPAGVTRAQQAKVG